MYRVNELSQILSCDNGIEISVGKAKEGTPIGDYEDISNIIDVQPAKPEPTQADRIEMKLDIINLRAEGIL